MLYPLDQSRAFAFELLLAEVDDCYHFGYTLECNYFHFLHSDCSHWSLVDLDYTDSSSVDLDYEHSCSVDLDCKYLDCSH